MYLGTDLLAAWGLNLEFGVAGVANLAFIVTIAAGAYAYTIFTIGSPTSNGNFQKYVGGFSFSFPIALAAGILAGGVVGVVIAITGLKRLRQDYQAMAMLVVSLMAATVVSADTPFLNGNQGLVIFPSFAPFSDQDPEVQRWAYVAIVFVACAAAYFLLRRFTAGPFGRTLRAMRDDDLAAQAIGKDVVRLRLAVQAVGGAFGGLSGALLVAFIGGWSPSAWAYIETLALLTAVIVGGMGNDRGVTAGMFLIGILILQGVQFLNDVPALKALESYANRTGLIHDFGWIVLGTLTIVFIWLRPQGIFPERRPRYGGQAT
ncbi:MAG: branched-chain amino acid transport system permease protein [Chloroflexota bacterium]|nr:branched-chain amino acid transport system permease protein [Chloroflexota bacterium]